MQVRNTTAIFIINLSVSDLLFCCFNLPLAASKFLTRHWIWGPELCQLYPLIRYGLLGVSIFNILAITINRYVMIAHPYIYNRYTLCNNFKVILYSLLQTKWDTSTVVTLYLPRKFILQLGLSLVSTG